MDKNERWLLRDGKEAEGGQTAIQCVRGCSPKLGELGGGRDRKGAKVRCSGDGIEEAG